jgi:peptidoglycan/LPS O-acetylase OafA/YrhL
VTADRSPRGELVGLTVLRFGLALYALFYHVLFAWNPFVARDGSLLPALLSVGYVSVNGFFLLSGFVLAYVYGPDRPAAAKPKTWPFLRARFARIYPTHALGIALSVPLLILAGRAHPGATGDEVRREVVAVGLLIQAWIPDRALDLNGPSWSLSVEAFFYLCFPLLLWTFAPLRARTLAGVALAAFGLAVLAPLVHPLEGGVESATHCDRILLYDPLVHLPEFVLGAVTGLLFLRSPWERARGRRVSIACGAAVLVALGLGPHVVAGLIHTGLFDPLFALLIFAIASGFPPNKPPRRKTGLFVLLGRASYALYILHKPVYLWMARESGLGRATPSSAFVAAYVALSLMASVVVFLAFEEPMRRWLRGTTTPPLTGSA